MMPSDSIDDALVPTLQACEDLSRDREGVVIPKSVRPLPHGRGSAAPRRPVVDREAERRKARFHSERANESHANAMTLTAQIQSFCAQMALFFLPLPAIKYTETSLTLADLFLIPAILLNFSHALRLRAFQIPFLLALPINLLSHMLDPDGSLIPILQMVYLWGFLIPFGWCAFVNLPPERIAFLLVIASGLSCLVAMGQFAGVVPTLPTQKVIDYKDSSRAAGLVLQCNSLTMALTPCFLFLPSVRQASLRILLLLLLLGGIASTVSKSAILAVPGLLFYFFWREPEKGRVLRWLVVVGGIGLVIFNGGANLGEMFDKLNATVEVRLSNADTSIGDRSHLAQVAFDYSSECLLMGYGTEGTYRVMTSQAGMGQTVHVFYLGLLLIEGWTAVLLTILGFLGLFASLWSLRKYNDAIMLGAHLLAISVTTVLYLSYQYYPFLIAAAALVRAQAERPVGLQVMNVSGSARPRFARTTRRIESRPA
ncbi:MAG: O-antigen ligase family protein [Planctomycetaceae bacterium]